MSIRSKLIVLRYRWDCIASWLLPWKAREYTRECELEIGYLSDSIDHLDEIIRFHERMNHCISAVVRRTDWDDDDKRKLVYCLSGFVTNFSTAPDIRIIPLTIPRMRRILQRDEIPLLGSSLHYAMEFLVSYLTLLKDLPDSRAEAVRPIMALVSDVVGATHLIEDYLK